MIVCSRSVRRCRAALSLSSSHNRTCYTMGLATCMCVHVCVCVCACIARAHKPHSRSMHNLHQPLSYAFGGAVRRILWGGGWKARIKNTPALHFANANIDGTDGSAVCTAALVRTRGQSGDADDDDDRRCAHRQNGSACTECDPRTCGAPTHTQMYSNAT